MVVPVLMTSCHVSENPKIGPERSHRTITAAAIANARELPVHRVIRYENLSSHLFRTWEDAPFISSSPSARNAGQQRGAIHERGGSLEGRLSRSRLSPASVNARLQDRIAVSLSQPELFATHLLRPHICPVD